MVNSVVLKIYFRKKIKRMITPKTPIRRTAAPSLKAYSISDLEKLEAYLEQTHPEFNRKNPAYDRNKHAETKKQIRDALSWALGNLKSLKVKTIDDEFSDPLLLVNTMIKYASPDIETILAAILYPSVRPIEGNGVDWHRLADIQEKFGVGVRDTIENTLRFRSLNLNDEDVGLFRIMSLWAAQGRGPILIRAGQLLCNIKEEIEEPTTYNTKARDRMITNANEVYGPLLEVAGFGALQSELLNKSFQLEDPTHYADTCRRIADITREHTGTILKTITSYVEVQRGWIAGEHFLIEARPKEPHSARKKLIRKNNEIAAYNETHEDKREKLTLEQLGDLYGVRIVAQRQAIDEWLDKQEMRGHEATPEQEVTQFISILRDLRVRLSKKTGFDNKKKTHTRVNAKTNVIEHYSPTKEFFDKMVAEEPRDKDPARLKDPDWAAAEAARYPNRKDSCLVDYLDPPKFNGYRGLKDTLAIPVGNKGFILVEVQFVNYISHELNMFGPNTSHFAYKAEFGSDRTALSDWFAVANCEITARNAPNRQHVFVYDANGRIVDVTQDPTVSGFMRLTRSNNVEARIIDPLRPEDPDKTSGLSTKLVNGCRVIAL